MIPSYGSLFPSSLRYSSPTIGMEDLKKELISNADWIISNVPSMMNWLWNLRSRPAAP